MCRERIEVERQRQTERQKHTKTGTQTETAGKTKMGRNWEGRRRDRMGGGERQTHR